MAIELTRLSTPAAALSEFDAMLEDDAATFLREFGEDIIYCPKGGIERTIVAIVNRSGSAQGLQNVDDARPPMTVEARNANTAKADDDWGGIDNTSVTFTGEYVKVTTPKGSDTWKKYHLSQHDRNGESQDAGLCRYEVV